MPYHRKRTFECKTIFRASFVPLVLDSFTKAKTIPKQMQKGMVIFMDETDRTDRTNAPKTHDTLLALLCYLSILLFIPLLKKKKDDFVSYHVNQGLVLFIIEFIVGMVLAIIGLILQFASPIMYTVLLFVFAIFNLFFFICHIVGIIHVFCHKQKKIPVFGEIKIYKPEEKAEDFDAE